MPRKGNAEARAIQPGDVGIWATCAMKKEAKSVADLRDLFQEVGVMSSRDKRSTNSVHSFAYTEAVSAQNVRSGPNGRDS